MTGYTGSRAENAVAGTTGATRSITVELPLPPKHCWPNARGTVRERIADKREARETGYLCALHALGGGPRPGWTRVRATATYSYRVARTRDDDNCAAALKQYRDGIAAALMADGTDSGWTWDGPPAIGVDRARLPGVTIIVEPLDAA